MKGKYSLLTFSFLFLVNLSVQKPIFSDELGSSVKNSWHKMSVTIDSIVELQSVFLDNSYIQSYKDTEGIWQHMKKGEKLSTHAEKYGIEVSAILELNEMPEKKEYMINNQWVFIPFSEKYLKNLHETGIKRQNWDIPKAEFLWPVLGSRISSRIGKRLGKNHTGIDISVETGTIVVAAMDGEVTNEGYHGGYGLSILLEHEQNYDTRYAHLSVILVKKGQKVRKGQIIGFSGSTGYSTGPHLHFELRCNRIVLDPEFFLPEFDEAMEAAMGFNSNLENHIEKN
ncbi:MAG: M23 family metallopeptidase [Spirochaetia bacterium]|nr:M23 family metallopeptidase [Spirochaetia bacterium]